MVHIEVEYRGAFQSRWGSDGQVFEELAIIEVKVVVAVEALVAGSMVAAAFLVEDRSLDVVGRRVEEDLGIEDGLVEDQDILEVDRN